MRNTQMDFGFERIGRENDILLIDSSALQASRTKSNDSRPEYTTEEKISYVRYVAKLMKGDKMFTAPLAGGEIKSFYHIIPSLRIEPHYKGILYETCSDLAQRILSPTQEEQAYIDEVYKRFNIGQRGFSMTNEELFLHGLAFARFRGNAGILTNNTFLLDQSRRVSAQINETELVPQNALSIYAKFNDDKLSLRVFAGKKSARK